jgi:hypothetical protein
MAAPIEFVNQTIEAGIKDYLQLKTSLKKNHF